MEAILTFQAVGRYITFYLVKLMADGLYLMYELRSFTVPGCINQILFLPCYFDDIYFILNVYRTHCVQMTPEQANESKRMKRPTLLTPEFDRIIDKTTNRKRRWITKRSH
ncbi:uncharacterized protein BX664DRAFT_331648 [Halteromyces radiatus]|uniref:uncharacterized protein n=1 Tax=Halteromyces radiatus TaxID=101107 RepID=UPI00221FA661|nr:uncharacterized protein BX664DRAFT_331648 [Halteromyces radiatus]KAI8088880.1 hypothetical protein BX664DRAFT_331648 [Halteromyces radiatus]